MAACAEDLTHLGGQNLPGNAAAQKLFIAEHLADAVHLLDLIGERLHVAGRQAVVHDDEMGSRHAEVLFQAAGTLNPREVLRQAVE